MHTRRLAKMLPPAVAWILGSVQAHAGVVINELLPNPDGPEPGNELVEIFNTGPDPIDVTGWAIEDAATIDNSDIRARIPEDFLPQYGTGASIAPGEFRVVGAEALNNTGDTVYLVFNRTDNLAAVVHSVSYGAAPAEECWANLPDGATPENFDWRTCTIGASNCAADVVPPAAVDDLVAVAGTYLGEVDLAWTAVGNDGQTGQALQQIVKYNTVPITEANFATSVDVFNVPLPGPPGTPHDMTVFGLDPGITYFFAIKTRDCGNFSAISTTVPSTQPGTTPLPFPDRTVGLQHFYGNLHSHTGYSDGQSTPTAAYDYARNTAPTPLDFLAVTDHNHSGAGPMSPSLYQQGLMEAAAATQDGAFVAIYGQEWGIAANGHVIVFEAPVLFGWEAGNFDVFVAQDDYTGLHTAILNNPSPWGALAQMCHPGAGDFEDYAFTVAGGTVVCGIALVNGPANSTVSDESDIGNTNFDEEFYTALRHGFFASPVADQDNHNANWGASTQSRTVVLANALTKTALLDAIAKRRTYASQDHNVQVDMRANGWPMGSRFEAEVGAGVNFDVTVGDPDGEGVLAFELFRGTPGASFPAEPVATAQGVDRFVLRDEEQPPPPADAIRVYTLRITQDDNHRIWTAPVEVTFATVVDVAERAPEPGLGARLFAPRPNPFNPATRIRFELTGPGRRHVSLRLYDVRGRHVRTFVNGRRGPGVHEVVWDGSDSNGSPMGSGVYLARLLAPGADRVKRLVLLR